MTTAPLWTLCRRTLGAAFLIAAAATFVASTAVAQEAEPTFASANSAYQQGRYAEAAGQLEQLAALKGWSAPLLYDWANAQARQGALGAALLGYRRAALLSPRDPDITANLAHVQEQLGLSTPTLPWFERATRALSLSVAEWTALSLGTLWLLCAALAALALSKRGRGFWAGCAVALGMATLVSGAGFVVMSVELRTAVVTAKAGTELRLSPFDGADSQGRLREGESLRADVQHGSYLHVRVRDGQQGWIDSAAVEPLVPGAS